MVKDLGMAMRQYLSMRINANNCESVHIRIYLRIYIYIFAKMCNIRICSYRMAIPRKKNASRMMRVGQPPSKSSLSVTWLQIGWLPLDQSSSCHMSNDHIICRMIIVLSDDNHDIIKWWLSYYQIIIIISSPALSVTWPQAQWLPLGRPRSLPGGCTTICWMWKCECLKVCWHPKKCV